MAFVNGWNLILEYLLGAASVAKALSDYVDDITGKSLSEFLQRILDYSTPWGKNNSLILNSLESSSKELVVFNAYFDIIAFGIIFLVTVLLCWGIKETAIFISVLTTINISAVIFLIFLGTFKWNFQNWEITESDARFMILNSEICQNATHPCNAGQGGFFPFGINGVLVGAATTFFAYIGFDEITTAGLYELCIFTFDKATCRGCLSRHSSNCYQRIRDFPLDLFQHFLFFHRVS